ncbi:MAG: hypothetical protein R3C28_17830 [Pirellulaceae bacterium]
MKLSLLATTLLSNDWKPKKPQLAAFASVFGPRQANAGKVLSVGDGKLLADGSRAAHQVKEGDRVFFLSYAGTEVVVDDERLLIMSEDEILAILE